MTERDLTEFLRQNQFVPSPGNSIPDRGMDSRVDAFSSGGVMLRVVVDRGQRFIDLAKAGTDLWRDVFTLAFEVDPTFQVKTGSFCEAISVLIHYWPRISAAL